MNVHRRLIGALIFVLLLVLLPAPGTSSAMIASHQPSRQRIPDSVVEQSGNPPARLQASTPTPPGNRALRFDGQNDEARGPQVSGLAGAQTIELWVRPASRGQNSIILATTDDVIGWALELNSGRATWWVATPGGWRFVRHSTVLAANTWHHVAVTYDGVRARVFVNGSAGSQSSIGAITEGPLLRIGGIPGYGFFWGEVDDIRLSNVVRYTSSFVRPSTPHAVDASTRALFRFDEGSGQFTADVSGNGYTLTLGSGAGADDADPQWVTSTVPVTTPTPGATATATRTPSPTATATRTPSATATRTPSATATRTPSATATDTATPSPSATATDAATPSPSATATDTATPSPSATATDTATPSPSATATDAATPSPSATATDTATPSPSATATDAATPSPSATATDAATPSPSATATDAATPSPSATATDTATPSPSATATDTATPSATATNTAIPSATATPAPPVSVEWSQHGANAQRTSSMDAVIPTPWRLNWIWNGPNASGRVRSDKIRLPRGIQPVTGGGRVYVAAGSSGVVALNAASGAEVWRSSPGGSINSTPAYDPGTGAIFVVSTNGALYKLDAATGAILGQVATGASSSLPLPPLALADRVVFSMGSRVYACDSQTLALLWTYDAGAPLHTPPSYSARFNRIVAVSSDLYVHAIDNASGARIWRVKPTTLDPGDPGSSVLRAEASYGWPVIAEEHGLVLIKLRLNWNTLWTWSPWPSTNAAMRSNLQARPDQQALHVLRIEDGATAFIANVGHGGFGDGNYMPMGPQPVVKRFADGQEVAYVVMRGSPCQASPCDGRWDSHLGEMVLDDTTIPGYQAGYVRFIRNTFFPTDEQANLSMAGEYLFAAHWEAGIAHRITDRSPLRGGSSGTPIVTENLPHIATSQDTDVCGRGFQASHYCAAGLSNTRQWPGGFYIYWREGAVYDRYWTEYAVWTASGDAIYFLSTDGALVALTQGEPQASGGGSSVLAARPNTFSVMSIEQTAREQRPLNLKQAALSGRSAVIPYTSARAYSGEAVTVEGTIRVVFNNGKAVYLGFENPHRGAFKVRILKASWKNFPAAPETQYTAGQRVQVTGVIGWYQGDPVIIVEAPEQIVVKGEDLNQPGG